MNHHAVDKVDGGIYIHIDFEEEKGKECLLMRALCWILEKLCLKWKRD